MFQKQPLAGTACVTEVKSLDASISACLLQVITFCGPYKRVAAMHRQNYQDMLFLQHLLGARVSHICTAVAVSACKKNFLEKLRSHFCKKKTPRAVHRANAPFDSSRILFLYRMFVSCTCGLCCEGHLITDC